jgi:hypothetical protein
VDKDVKDLVAFAKDQGISYKVLKMFNPWLRDTKLNVKRGKVYTITVPKGEYEDYESLLDGLDDDPVVFGDTLNFEEL